MGSAHTRGARIRGKDARIVKLQTRLIAVLLGVSLVPLLVVGVIAAISARSALEQRSYDQLSAIRSVKKEAIESYFGTVRDQTITLASNPSVVAGMRDLRAAFRNHASEAGTDRAGATRGLADYYQRQFLARYAKDNPGQRAPDMRAALSRLDANALSLQAAWIAANRNPLGSKHLLDATGDGSAYDEAHRRLHPSLRQFVEKFGYYDVFLIDAATGDVVYSMYKELDFATNLNRGAWAGTALAKAFRSALRQPRDGFAIEDFATYTPSYDAPAGFSAVPIHDGGRLIGVLAFQLPLDRISKVMAERSGLGETGETYLVGADHLMRSDSFLDPEHRSVVASFRHPDAGSVKTESATRALAGDTGASVTADYRGNPVLSAYMPVDAAGLKWALLAEIDTAEAFADVESLTDTMLLVGLLAALAIAGVGWYFARGIAMPMQRMAGTMARVQREGEFSHRTEVHGQDEIAMTGNAVNALLAQLEAVFGAANHALAELSAGRFDARVGVDCNGALATLARGIDHAIESVGVSTARQEAQASELARSAEEQRAQAERIAAVAAENTRVRQALDCVSTGAMIADADDRIVYTNGAVQALLRAAEPDLRTALPGFRPDAVVGQSIDIFHRDPTHQRRLLASLHGTHRAEIKVGGRVFALTVNPIVDGDRRLGSVVEWADKTQERAIEREIETIVQSAAAGDFTRRVDVAGKSGFFATLSGGLNELVARVGQTIDGAAQVLVALSEGELRQRMQGEYAGTFAELQRATNETIERLTETIGGIDEASDTVFVAAGELAESANALRARTEEQNSALESAASSIAELTQSVGATAESAAYGRTLAEEARTKASRGDEVVRATVDAMQAITQTSEQISDITSLINDIAFQTNLLALNAAVEAARAGEQGKGFAVVAGEVRNLAGRASEAAKNISELIRTSAERVEEGARMATLSGETLRDVMDAFTRVSSAISEVSSATQEQSSSIQLVARTVTDLESMTQQNAAAVEESSAAAESVADQSRSVRELLSFFRTG